MNEAITFTPLARSHFPLLLTWLHQPHVQQWWDKHPATAIQQLEEKFGPRIDGKQAVHCYIIHVDHVPIGFIQFYNAWQSPRIGYNLKTVQQVAGYQSLAALDFYIGDPVYLGKGLGAHILKTFLVKIIQPLFKACLVDPDTHNIAAIKSYERAGFKPVATITLDDGTQSNVIMLATLL